MQNIDIENEKRGLKISFSRIAQALIFSWGPGEQSFQRIASLYSTGHPMVCTTIVGPVYTGPGLNGGNEAYVNWM